MLQGFNHLEMPMNAGKTLFAQVMDFVPRKTFGRIVDRHRGDAGVRTLSCTELFRIMAFAQLTWRESFRDIEACLTANQSKLFHMGMRHIPARSTLADALNSRDWRIYHALAMRLIDRARRLYAQEPMGVDLDATVYALDSTTIDLCLGLFDWAPFRSTKAAVKMHTLLDLRGAIPAFIHISDGKMHDVHVLDIPSDFSERAFDRFYRGPDALAKGINGYGLGLSLCQEIAKVHGGSITIDTTHDRVFMTLILPVTT